MQSQQIGFPQYMVSFLKSTSLIERVALSLTLLICLLCIATGIYYFVVIASVKDNTGEELYPWNVSRDMWMARDVPDITTTESYEPLRVVVIQHTVTPECYTFDDCAAAMRLMQLNSLNEKYPEDIPYNFVIGNDGRVYEARGWGVAGSHSKWLNPCAVAIAFIGDYREEISGHTEVTDLQLNRTLELLEYGVKTEFLHPDYVVMGAKDFRDSESPGSNLYKAIQKWDHYFQDRKYKEQTCDQIHWNVSDKLDPRQWFVNREMWEAKSFPHENISDEFHPIRLVVIQNTVSSECHSFDTCAVTLQHLQIWFNLQDRDIPYNFIIGNDGRVYETSGWGTAGSNSRQYDLCSISIGFLGQYSQDSKYKTKLSEAQMLRMKLLLLEGVDFGYLHPDYVLTAAKDMFSTESPAIDLYEAIQTHPHYSRKYQNMTCEQIYGIANDSITIDL